MENQNNPTQPTQPAPQQQAQQAPPPLQAQQSSGSKKKIIIIFLAVLGILVVAFSGYFVFQRFSTQAGGYEFTINNSSVSQENFNAVYSYFNSQEENQDTALERAKNIFIENAILKEDYLASGGNQESLEQLISNSNITLSQDMPQVLKQLMTENSVLTDAVSQNIEVTQSSGYIFVIRFSTTDQAEKTTMTALATRKLSSLRTQFESGASVAELQTQFEQDPELQNVEGILATTGDFQDMSPDHPTLPGESFSMAVFDTPRANFSNIFESVSQNTYTYGVVYITEKKEGENSGYLQWLTDKKKNTEVKFKLVEND